MRHGYFLGLGSNVEPVKYLGQAIEQLLKLTDRLEVSRIIQTAPVNLPTITPFLNAVIYLETELDGDALKARLNRIETELGRDRTDPDRASKDRTIDLDILLETPADVRAVTAAQVAEAPYHRPLFLELLCVLGIDCPLPTAPLRGGREIAYTGRRVGLTPFQVERAEGSSSPRLRPRRAVLVTGAAVRLGRAIAASLAKAGYDIALHYNSSHAAAEEAAEEFRSHGVRCQLFPFDLADTTGIGDFVEKVCRHLPHLNVLVNSASVYQQGRIQDTTPATLERQWDINFKAPFFLMAEFHRHVEHGSIINILDNKIAYNQFHYAAYLSSKKALAELTRMAALEFAPRIRVNGVAPGVVLPASNRSDSYLDWRKAAIPVNELGAPEQVCSMIAAILDNRFINGQIVYVDGGEAINFVGRNALEFGVDATDQSVCRQSDASSGE